MRHAVAAYVRVVAEQSSMRRKEGALKTETRRCEKAYASLHAQRMPKWSSGKRCRNKRYTAARAKAEGAARRERRQQATARKAAGAAACAQAAAGAGFTSKIRQRLNDPAFANPCVMRRGDMALHAQQQQAEMREVCRSSR